MGFLRRKARKAARWLQRGAQSESAAPGGEVAAGRGLLFEEDAAFNALYDRGLERSRTHPTRLVAHVDKRRERYYNLLQLLEQSGELEGSIAECGCWKGLSSYLLLSRLRALDPRFDGTGFHVVDSFEGLSPPTESDRLAPAQRIGEREFGGAPGEFQADLEHVRAVTSEFPGVSFHRGWIPEVLKELPETRWRFVHVDLDLHDPTRGAFDYFYDRLVRGGLLVCDDYGSIAWPGARKAVDSFCAERRLRPLALSTGQAVLWRRS